MITVKKLKTKKKCNRVMRLYFNSITVKCLSCEWNPDAVWVVNKED